jgi:hypothetical protein
LDLLLPFDVAAVAATTDAAGGVATPDGAGRLAATAGAGGTGRAGCSCRGAGWLRERVTTKSACGASAPTGVTGVVQYRFAVEKRYGRSRTGARCQLS